MSWLRPPSAPKFEEVECPTCHRKVQRIADGFTARLVGHWPRALTDEEAAALLRREPIGLQLCPGDTPRLHSDRRNT